MRTNTDDGVGPTVAQTPLCVTSATLAASEDTSLVNADSCRRRNEHGSTTTTTALVVTTPPAFEFIH